MRSSPAGPSDGRGLGGRRRDPGRRRGLLSLASATCGRARRSVDPRRGVVARDVGRPAVRLRRPRDARSEDEAREARILAPIGAFQPVGPSSVERGGREVRLTQRLACLGPGCVPGRENRVVPLPAARVVAGGRTTTAPTVSIAVVPRVPAVVVAARDPAYRRQTGIPPAGFSPSPTVLAALAAGAAALLVLVAVVLVATGLRGGVRAAAHRGGRVRARRSAPAGVAGPAEPGPAAGGRAPRAGGEDARGGRAGHERRPCGLVAATA